MSLTSMNEEQRNCVLRFTLLVYIMDVERAEPVHFDVAREHGYFVDGSLSLAPVKPFLPVGREAFDVGQRSTIVPASVVKLVREADEVELSAKEVEIGVRDCKSESFL